MRSGVIVALLILWEPSFAFATTTLLQRRPDAGDEVFDAYLWSDTPGTNSGSSTSIYSSYNSGEKRALVRFTLDSIPTGAVLTSSSLQLHAFGADGRPVNVSRMGTPWAENTATWNSLDGGSTAGGPATFTAAAGLNVVDVTDHVRQWLNGAPNYGFILIEGPGTASTQYASSEYSMIDQRPRLEINWSSRDAGQSDAGSSDAGASDAGASDAGPSDAGPSDAGPSDAGPSDAGPSDAGQSDAGPSDAGESEAGADAGGGGGDRVYLVGCSSAPVGLLGWAALLLLLKRRRR